MKYFDFHCHLDTQKLDENREEVLAIMKKQEIGCCTIGVNKERSAEAVRLANKHDGVWACVGQHPIDAYAEEYHAGFYQQLIDENEKVVCVGECGLDYYRLSHRLTIPEDNKYTEADQINEVEFEQEKKRQRNLFRLQIDLAVANDLPLMLHVRSAEGTQDAHLEVLEILEEKGRPKAVFHFYTEGPELAKKIISAGYHISFPGVITFGKKVVLLEEVVRQVPLEQMFAETDTPYAAPVPNRGKVNMPVYVPCVYKHIAALRGEDSEKVRIQILQNIENFFAIRLLG